MLACYDPGAFSPYDGDRSQPPPERIGAFVSAGIDQPSAAFTWRMRAPITSRTGRTCWRPKAPGATRASS